MSSRSIRRGQLRRQQREQRRARRLAVAAGATGCVLLGPAQADAANLAVTSVNDSGANTLRAAITTANANAQDDNITFSGAAASGTIRLATPLAINTDAHKLTITGPVTISGDTDNNTTPDTQLFRVTTDDDQATVTLTGLTLTKGTSADGGGAIKADASNTAPLVLTDDAITNSKSTGTTTATGGGAIDTTGDLTLTRTVMTGNTATGTSGGAVAVQGGETIVDGSTFSGNSAHIGGALALKYDGSFTMRDSTVTSNQGVGANSAGGGIALGLVGMHIRRSTISGNSAASGGGLTAYSAKYASFVENSTISDNTATSIGGGAVLLPLKYDGGLRNTTVTGNKAPQGAGVVIGSFAAGRAIVDRSTITGNGNGSTSVGGGIAVAQVTGGGVEVLNSTVTGNTATDGGGVAVGLGSAVFTFDEDGNKQGRLDLDNSTIAANTGSGVFLNSYTSGTVTKSADIGMNSTIVAGNGVDTDRKDNATAGGITAAFSLIQSPGDAPLTSTGVITGQDPLLGALADNGGPTTTMLPAGISPVLDAGRAGATILTDQRGQPRTVDTGLSNTAGADGTDIGAVELPASSVVVPSTDPVLTVSAGKTPIGSATPLLPVSSTPITCTVTLVELTGCDVEIRSLKKIKLSGKETIPKGTLLAEARSSSPGATTLKGKVKLTTDGRAVLAKAPAGVQAGVSGVGSYGTSSATRAAGRVLLLAKPKISFKLGDDSSLPKALKRELKTLGGQLATAEKVSVKVSGPSQTQAEDLAKSAGKELTSGGLAVKPKVSGAKSSTSLLEITFKL
jgi:hypothetical protein